MNFFFFSREGIKRSMYIQDKIFGKLGKDCGYVISKQMAADELEVHGN